MSRVPFQHRVNRLAREHVPARAIDEHPQLIYIPEGIQLLLEFFWDHLISPKLVCTDFTVEEHFADLRIIRRCSDLPKPPFHPLLLQPRHLPSQAPWWPTAAKPKSGPYLC